VQTEPELLARFRDANILMLPWRTSARAYGPYWTVKWNINVDVLIRLWLMEA